LIANPFIRHLVLYGDDVQGHFPGDAIWKLFENGVDTHSRIKGAIGARPVLKNLTQIEVDQFRSQVSVSNLSPTDGPNWLTTHVSNLHQLSSPAFDSGLRIELVKPVIAEPAKRLKLDRSGYFVIMAMQGSVQPLVVEHYTNDGVLRNVIEGTEAASICATIIEKKLVSQLDHAAYLGRELARAEASITSKSPYVQDKAQGHSDACTEWC
jgi:tetrahydromethanopterin S-methyltransferase subunit A